MGSTNPSQPPTPPKPPEKDKVAKEPSSGRKEIPLVSVPDDREMLAQEMEEMFDEDRVTHQHGSSEPEAD